MSETKAGTTSGGAREHDAAYKTGGARGDVLEVGSICVARELGDTPDVAPDVARELSSAPDSTSRKPDTTPNSAHEAENVIRFNQAGFTYDGETFVFRDLNLSVARGEFLCILGGNGSGKSTLAKHMNALLVPDEGTVWVLGRTSRDSENIYFIRQNAGMVLQNPDDQLVASLVENDVAFGPENLGVPTNELAARVTQALAEVGLQGYGTHETSALSGGQKQRVAIAGVLSMKPQILILDEASAMLDPRGRRGLLRVCKNLHEQGMTIVMITHFMDHAALATRVIALKQGRICLDGTPEEVLTQKDELDKLDLEVPFACKLSQLLQSKGVPVRTCITESQLKEELCRLHLTR